MKNYFLPLFLVALSTLSFSQSKKEQIEILNARVDSVKQILSSERKTSADKSLKISDLNSKINDLDGKILTLEKEKTNLNNSISKLTGEITSLNASVNQLKSDLNMTKSNMDNTIILKNQEIGILNVQIKTKSDSLKLVQNELNKLKPAPKQINTNQNTTSIKRYSDKEIEAGPGYEYLLVKATKEKVNGVVYAKHNNGTLLFEATYKEGLKNGPCKYFESDGRISIEENYKIFFDDDLCKVGCSKFDGIQKTYHYNGRLKRKTDYRNGKAWEDRCYDANGDEIKPCPKDY